jgi:hypothetical protein
MPQHGRTTARAVAGKDAYGVLLAPPQQHGAVPHVPHGDAPNAGSGWHSQRVAHACCSCSAKHAQLSTVLQHGSDRMAAQSGHGCDRMDTPGTRSCGTVSMYAHGYTPVTAIKFEYKLGAGAAENTVYAKKLSVSPGMSSPADIVPMLTVPTLPGRKPPMSMTVPGSSAHEVGAVHTQCAMLRAGDELDAGQEPPRMNATVPAGTSSVVTSTSCPENAGAAS